MPFAMAFSGKRIRGNTGKSELGVTMAHGRNVRA